MKSKVVLHNKTKQYSVISTGHVPGEFYDRTVTLLKPNELTVLDDGASDGCIFGGAFYFNTYREADNYRRYCLGL